MRKLSTQSYFHTKKTRPDGMIEFLGLWSILLFFFFGISHVNAEGTAQLVSNRSKSSYGNLNVGYNNWATYACPDKNTRLIFRVNSTNETIFIGLRADLQYLTDCKVHIISCSSGLEIPFPGVPFNLPVTGSPGYINTLDEACAGPSQIVSGGYKPLEFTNLQPGDYSLEFEFHTTTYPLEQFHLLFFDLTIAKKDSFNKYFGIPGRLWSTFWSIAAFADLSKIKAGDRSFAAPPSSNLYPPLYGAFYVYTKDQIVNRLNTNGMRPGSKCEIYCNAFGTSTDSLAWVGKSEPYAVQALPQYKIFLNAPDINVYLPGKIGTITEFDNVPNGCNAAQTFTVKVSSRGLVNLKIDLEPFGYNNGEDRIIVAPVNEGLNTIIWDGLDGRGNAILPDKRVDISASFLNGLTNFPVYDAEGNESGILVDYIPAIAGGYGTPKAQKIFWDDSDPLFVNGTKNDIDGCTYNASAGCHSWPFYDTDPSAGFHIGNNTTINSWWYFESGQQSKSIIISLLEVDAGPDAVICSGQTFIPVNTMFIGYNQANDIISWGGGTGTFDHPDSQYPVYSPSIDDMNAGKVTLTVTVKSLDGKCIQKDNLTLTIIKSTLIMDNITGRHTCEGVPYQLTGISVPFGDMSSIKWVTNGSGTLSGASTLSPIYIAKPPDGGKDIKLTLTLPGNNVCGQVTKDILLHVDPLPVTTFKSSLVCAGQTVTFTMTGSYLSSLRSGKWFFGDENYNCSGVPLSCVESHTFKSASVSMPVKLSVTDVNGCTYSSTQNISVPETPECKFTIEEVTDYYGRINLKNLSTGATNYNWDFGNGEKSVSPEPSTSYKEEGTYLIQLKAISKEGCFNVSYNQYKFLTTNLFMPNAFAPADIDEGVRVFKPSGRNLKEYRLEVYDRWGKIIWHSEKLTENGEPAEGWDGTLNGIPVQVGVYVWKVFGRFNDGTIYGNHLNKDFLARIQGNVGTVTLIR